MSASGSAFINYSGSSSMSYSTDSKCAALSVRPEEHIDDVDAAMPQQDVLIPPWSANHRSSRPPALPSALESFERGPVDLAILPIRNNFTHNNRQNVLHRHLNVGPSETLSTSSLYQDVLPRLSPGSHIPSSSSSSQNASINNINNRLRTSLPVFGTTSELAAHYGIPRKFPQPPSINNNNTRPPVPHFNEPVPSSEHSHPPADQTDPLHNLMAGYLDMLKTNPGDNNASASTVSPVVGMDQAYPTLDASAEEAAQSIATMLLGTPDMMWSEYLTSPFDESPSDFPLETPAQGSADMNEFFTSPAVADLNSFELYDDMPLFSQAYGEDSLGLGKMPMPTLQSQISAPAHTDLEGLIPMSPVLDKSPQIEDSPDSAPVSKRKRNPTGTRKNITPDTLVPLDAPTQTRSYVTPSTTSRKELPAVFARKRARSTAFGDEEDELLDDADGKPTPSEAEAIEAKRRQNTLAARRSRKRKLEYQKQLEDTIEELKGERDLWKNRAILFQTKLATYGVHMPFPETSDS